MDIEEKKQEEPQEPSSFVMKNPSRVLDKQKKFIQYIENRYQPIIKVIFLFSKIIRHASAIFLWYVRARRTTRGAYALCASLQGFVWHILAGQTHKLNWFLLTNSQQERKNGLVFLIDTKPGTPDQYLNDRKAFWHLPRALYQQKWVMSPILLFSI